MTDLREHLQALYDEHGSLTAQIVVDAARAPDHPLHDRIPWDDGEAARVGRLHVAARLIRSVKVRYAESSESDPREVRAFVCLPTSDATRSAYQPVEVAMADDFSRELLLREMERDWQSFRRRWRHMKEFAAIVRRDVA